MMFTWFSAVSFFGVITCLFLSWFTYVKNSRNSVNRWYATTLFCMANWCLDSFLVSSFRFEQVIVLHNILYLGPIFSQLSFLKWVEAIYENFNIEFKRSAFYKALSSLFTIWALYLSLVSLLGNLSSIGITYNFA